jgi:ABC-type Fe3+ transport system permease subunit
VAKVGAAAAILLVFVGFVVAFWAGMRWRHNSLAWQTHKVQAGRARDAKKAKWASLLAAIISTAALIFYAFVATGTALGAYDKPSKSPSPSTHSPTAAASIKRP